MSQIALAYIPCPSREEALRIARALLEKKLIACANIHPITSVYNWEGKVQEEEEIVLLGKTTVEQFHNLTIAVEEIHPYDVPCVLRLQGEANQSYFAWLSSEVTHG